MILASGIGIGMQGAPASGGYNPTDDANFKAAWLGENAAYNASDKVTSISSLGSGPSLSVGAAVNYPDYIASSDMPSGKPGVRFDGSAHYLQTDAITLGTPVTIIRAFKQITFVSGDVIDDGRNDLDFTLQMISSGGELRLNHSPNQLRLKTMAVGEWALVTTRGDGTNGYIQKNQLAAVAGTMGAATMGGYVLAARPGASGASNIEWACTLLFDAVLTGERLTDAQQYAAAYAGITL